MPKNAADIHCDVYPCAAALSFPLVLLLPTVACSPPFPLLPPVHFLLRLVSYNEAFIHTSFGREAAACRVPPNLRPSASSASRAGDQNPSNAKFTTTSSPHSPAAMTCS